MTTVLGERTFDDSDVLQVGDGPITEITTFGHVLFPASGFPAILTARARSNLSAQLRTLDT